NTEKALRDELARLESKLSTDAQLDAELKQLLNDREQFASSFAKVGEGAAMVGSLIEPDVWDLMSPAARLAKLADLLKFADKASGAGKLADEFADIKVLTQKLADLENGRLPSQTELAKYHDQTALAKAIQDANKRGLGGPKATGTAGSKLPSSLPDNLTGYANPKDIRFTQDSVSNTFKDGKTLQATIDGLKTGKISPDDLPPIRVFEKDGVIYSLDNRRLLAASQAGVPIKIVPATPAEVAKEGWKMTTPNNGSIICVRGVCK
ncbi:hypothetical protein, partial [Ectopseudomonas alcaliphila]